MQNNLKLKILKQIYNFIINIYNKKVGGVIKHFGVIKYIFGGVIVNFNFYMFYISTLDYPFSHGKINSM